MKQRRATKTEDDPSLLDTLVLVEELHTLEVRCQELKTELMRRGLHALEEMMAALTEQERQELTAHPVPRKEAQQNVPENRLMRLKEVLSILGISRSSWYQGIKSGMYPPPIHLGPRTSVWRASDIDVILNQ
jgi:prophage regulatory protein